MRERTATPTYLSTFAWFLRRPALYRHLLYLATVQQVRKRSRRNRSAKEASAWCEERAVDTDAGLALLTGSGLETRFVDQYSAVLASARRALMGCPMDLGGAGNLDLLYCLTLRLKPSLALETGVAFGWSSLAVLLAMSKTEAGQLISTDLPMPFEGSDRWVGCVVPPALRSRWCLVARPDRLALRAILRTSGPAELCHYDSDKSYHGRMWTYRRIWSALRPGGILISHDVGDNVAFRDFAADRNVEPVVVRHEHKFQGVLTKRPNHES